MEFLCRAATCRLVFLFTWTLCSSEPEGVIVMPDILVLIAVAAAFVGAAGYAYLCERL